jgi:DNA invertase Pin-like site-specific DNA recombinase
VERDGGISEPQQIMKTKRIIIYGRVSTAEQRHDSQIAEVQDYCARRWGDSVAVTVITDTASGAKISREGLDQVLQLVRRNKIDVLACFKLDRLGRSLPHLAQIISELDQHNVAIIATSQGIDTNHDSPAGRLQMHVLMAVAQFERTLIVERVRAGQAAARAKGVKFGRPSTLARHKEKVCALLQQGLSCRAVARETDLPLGSVFNLSRAMRKPDSTCL